MLGKKIAVWFFKLILPGYKETVIMKIDSIGPQHDALKTAKKSASERSDKIRFSDVFNESIQLVGNPKEGETCSVAPPLPSMLAARQSSPHFESQAAFELLETLDNYMQMLGNPLVNLRMLEPAVQNMERAAEKAEAAMGHLTDGNPVKSVVAETTVAIRQEAERFKLGLYLDD